MRLPAIYIICRDHAAVLCIHTYVVVLYNYVCEHAVSIPVCHIHKNGILYIQNYQTHVYVSVCMCEAASWQRVMHVVSLKAAVKEVYTQFWGGSIYDSVQHPYCTACWSASRDLSCCPGHPATPRRKETFATIRKPWIVWLRTIAVIQSSITLVDNSTKFHPVWLHIQYWALHWL